MHFTGEYEYAIDAQQRLAIPAEIRARLEAGGHGSAVYLAPGGNGAIWIWPESTFDAMVGAMDQTLLPDDELMAFDEFFFSQSARVEMDKAGRIRIPERLRQMGGISQNVVVLGVRDHLELRDPEEWATRRRERLENTGQIWMRARKTLAEQQRRQTGP